MASLLERRLTLSRLVRQFAISAEGFASPPNAAEILTLADSFGTLIDDLVIEGGDLKQLDPLMAGSLAENWQDVLNFLEPALEAWPRILAGARSGRRRRSRAIAACCKQAATAPLRYGDRPVIAAGSTGSIPATAELLKAIAALPRGAVVLPGLDTTLSAEAARDADRRRERAGPSAVRAGEAAARARRGHRRCRGAGGRGAAHDASSATRWRRPRRRPAGPARATPSRPNSMQRSRACRSSPRPISTSRREQWRSRRGRRWPTVARVGIVSRDQTLARRIAAELKRHGVEVDDPAGTPLFQSSAGRLARQALAVAVNRYAPIDTVALLRNAAVTLGLDRFEVRKQANRLDLKLRGTAPAAGARWPPRPGEGGRRGLARCARRARAGAASRCAICSSNRRSTLPRWPRALDAAVTGLIGGEDLPGIIEFRDWAAGARQGRGWWRAVPAAHPRQRARRADGGREGAAGRAAARRHPHLGRARSAPA